MDIKSSLMYGSKAVNEAYTAKSNAAAKESRLASGKKLSATAEDAASLQIKSKAGETESAIENINAASSAVEDIAKAEEMIREANRRILAQSDDSVLAQANQTTDAVTKLLD
ncbi:MAG: hypothetical protein K2N95_17625 [Lachnospiraceae bacterium]|nr:hypothetical protein [Lachnospiraceae bacterium]